jgi:hypothetical protein
MYFLYSVMNKTGSFIHDRITVLVVFSWQDSTLVLSHFQMHSIFLPTMGLGHLLMCLLFSYSVMNKTGSFIHDRIAASHVLSGAGLCCHFLAFSRSTQFHLVNGGARLCNHL